jgi:uncharacterized protein YndB with AHSA1/START domain
MRDNNGTVTAAGTVCFQRVLRGPIERAWAYLTEPDKRAKWLASGHMDLRVGGRVELKFRDAALPGRSSRVPDRFGKHMGGHSSYGRVTRCDPPRLLSCTFGPESEDASEVTFELSPRGEDVLLRLTHRRLGERALRTLA